MTILFGKQSKQAKLMVLTAVTNLMAHSCSSLTFSTKNGVIPIDETWEVVGEESVPNLDFSNIKYHQIPTYP